MHVLSYPLVLVNEVLKLVFEGMVKIYDERLFSLTVQECLESETYKFNDLILIWIFRSFLRLEKHGNHSSFCLIKEFAD